MKRTGFGQSLKPGYPILLQNNLDIEVGEIRSKRGVGSELANHFIFEWLVMDSILTHHASFQFNSLEDVMKQVKMEVLVDAVKNKIHTQPVWQTILNYISDKLQSKKNWIEEVEPSKDYIAFFEKLFR